MKLLYRIWLATNPAALRIVVALFAIWVGVARLFSEPIAPSVVSVGILSYDQYSLLLVILGLAMLLSSWNGWRRGIRGKAIAAALSALYIMLGVDLLIIGAFGSASAIVLGLGTLYYEVLMPIYEC